MAIPRVGWNAISSPLTMTHGRSSISPSCFLTFFRRIVMRTLQVLGVLVFLMATFSVSQGADDDALKAGLKALEGKWEVTACQKDGEEQDDVIKLGIKLEFKDENMEIT